MRIQGQRPQGGCMGAGDLQVAHQQMADHRFRSCQGIHAAPLAVGRQLSTLRILGETGHHGDRRRPGISQTLARPQQRIGALQAAPAGSAGALLQMHSQRHIGAQHRTDLQPQRRPAGLRHLDLALGQLRLDAGIQQQADALPPYRPQQPLPRREAIQAIALHVMDAGIAPVERRTVQHIRVGDQATAGGGQQPGTGQRVTGVAADGTADARGHQHQRGHGRCRHGPTSRTASSCSRRVPSGRV